MCLSVGMGGAFVTCLRSLEWLCCRQEWHPLNPCHRPRPTALPCLQNELFHSCHPQRITHLISHHAYKKILHLHAHGHVLYILIAHSALLCYPSNRYWGGWSRTWGPGFVTMRLLLSVSRGPHRPGLPSWVACSRPPQCHLSLPSL